MGRENNVINLQVINLVATGTKITGDLLSDGDIRIDGEWMGNLESNGRLVIGASGKVEGEIRCKTCEISGTQKGKLFISDLLSLKATSNVSGDMVTGKLSIEPGAHFMGTCTMGDEIVTHDAK